MSRLFAAASAVVLCSAVSAQITVTTAGGTVNVATLKAAGFDTLPDGALVEIGCAGAATSCTYNEKFAVSGSNITVRGAAGVRVIIDGNGATTANTVSYLNPDRGVVQVVNRPNRPATTNVTIENIEVMNGLSGLRFNGSKGPRYAVNAAGIYVQNGAGITIRRCAVRGNSNGIFVSNGIGSGSATSDVVIERNYLYGNGNSNSDQEHNAYTEANRITYQFNHFGPPQSRSKGNNLKDRSAGTVIRYNWIEGGVRELDLVDSATFSTGSAAYGLDYVYGNMLLEVSNDVNRQIVHWGGDSGTFPRYRGIANGRPALRFYDNTVVSKRTDNTAIFRLDNAANTQRIDARNNVFYVPAGGFAILESVGIVDLAGNWLTCSWRQSFQGGGSVSVTNNYTSAETPLAFRNAGAGDYRLAAPLPGVTTTPLADLSSEWLPVEQHMKPQQGESRPSEADPGAWAYSTAYSLWTAPGAGPSSDPK